MAYKFKTVTVNDSSFLLEALKDFLVTDCGWTDESPAGQDDEIGAGSFHGVLGHFLRSSGEDGNDDLCMHLFNAGYTGGNTVRSHLWPAFSYLAAGIGPTDGTATVDDDTELAGVATPFAVRMNDELAIVSGVSGGVVTFSQRGAYGTTPETHVTGDLLLNTKTKAFAEVYAYRDLAAILSSSGTTSVGTKSAFITPGLSGYVDDRFNLHAMLKVVDGPEAGKMRPITDYASTNGDFDYLAFKNAPGTANVAVVSMGFLPALSRRIGTAYYSAPKIENANQGVDTVCWFYGSKDGVIVMTKFNGGYNVFFSGNVYPFSAKDCAASTAQASAGANTMDVDDITLITVGEKFRIISQDIADWATNVAGPGGGEAALDPEEIPTEEVVIQSITPGSGSAGTLVFNANLKWTYATGAVIGEDPRPACRQAPPYAGISAGDMDVMEGTDCWLPVYNPCEKTQIGAHASHRQVWRSVHATGDITTRSEADLYTRFRGTASRKVGSVGSWAGSLSSLARNNDQNARPLAGLVSLYNSDQTATYNGRGIWPAAKGTVPHLWWVESYAGSPPLSAVQEDTYLARWGSAYAPFRVFTQRGSTIVWCICGPEIA